MVSKFATHNLRADSIHTFLNISKDLKLSDVNFWRSAFNRKGMFSKIKNSNESLEWEHFTGGGGDNFYGWRKDLVVGQ